MKHWKLNEDQLEDMEACARHHGMPHVLLALDDIIENIKTGFLSVPLDKDPEKAALSLYAKRMELEGAVAAVNAFRKKVQEMRSAK